MSAAKTLMQRPMFQAPAQPEILRALQKDQEVIRTINEQIQDLSYKVLGRNAPRYTAEANLLGNLSYYGATTMSSQRTLGEEYCDMLQVVGPIQNLQRPKIRHHAHLIFLHVLLPYLYQKMRTQARRVPLDPRRAAWKRAMVTVWNKLVQWVVSGDNVVALLSKLHLAAFYLYGTYAHPANRFSQMRYIKTSQSQFASPIQYRYLGILLAVQLGLSAGFWALDKVNTGLQTSDDPLVMFEDQTPIPPDDAPLCQVCLSRRRAPTALPCGHIFCWVCAAESLQRKRECPMCRQLATPQQMIPLQHYD